MEPYLFEVYGHFGPYNYGPNAELSQVTNPEGDAYRYIRDKAGHLIEEHDYSGAITRYDYDLAGRLIRTQKPDGVQCTYAYDDSDRLLEKTLTPQQGKPTQVTYAYDGAGRLIEAHNAHSHIALKRDGLGRVTQESHNGNVLQTTYNPDGYRETLQGEGIQQHWQYGPEQQLQHLQLGEHSPLHFQYTYRGQENYRYSEQGFGLLQHYDHGGRLHTQQAGMKIPDAPGHLPHAPNIERQFHYDPGGRLDQLQETFWGQTRYQYDKSDRITEAEHGYGKFDLHRQKETFHYNPNGDLQTAGRSEVGSNVIPLDPQQKPRHYLSGKVHRIHNVYYLYDANGRLKEKREHPKGFRPQVWRYRWDDEDQLIGVTKPNGEQWRYDYDPFGRRIKKTKTRRSRNDPPWPEGYDRPIRQGSAFQWDGDQLIREAPVYADGAVAWDQAETWHYEADSFRPIAKEQNGQLLYVITDHLGTPRELMNDRGIELWRGKFGVWGELLAQEAINDADYDNNKPQCNLRFQGQYYDTETGLHYNRHRYYDPQTTQYLSADPMGLAGGLTPQAYVHDPNGWVDPLGLSGDPCETGGDATKSVTVSRGRFPESAKHIEDAVASGKPNTLTINRGGAAANRRDSLRGVQTKPGLDRDEFPPAMFQEGGKGASVRHINRADNRGSGACIGAQCRGLPDGLRVRIDVVD